MTDGFVPQAAPQLRIAAFRAEVDAAIAAVLSGGTYILGEAVAGFEAAFATFAKAPFCVGVASGTDAIALALRALGIGPGDEVIVPGMTFAGTAHAVLHCGATPCFVDVEPESRCIDPDAAAAAVTPRAAAIVPVHLFGAPCDMPRLVAIAERHGLAIVEDCAQSHGASLDGVALGTFGQAAAYSFYPTKNLGCIGDGGAVTTRDPALAVRLRSLRHYGFEGAERISHRPGFNSRLDEMQAAILNVLLPHLEASNDERRIIASAYRRGLAGQAPFGEPVGLPLDAPGNVYHQFAITHPRRDALAARLKQGGIGTAVHYAPGLHRHPAFAGSPQVDLPVTERLAATLLSLPIQPEVAAPAVARIIEAIARQVVAA